MTSDITGYMMEKDRTFIAGTYNRFPVLIEKGRGSVAFGSDGKKYIDMESGYGTNIFGFCDPQWIEAVKTQLDLVQHTSNLYYSEPCIRAAELLVRKCGLKKVFFTNSGGESNECAIKAARKYASLKKGDGCFKIITLKHSFHGRGLGSCSASGEDHYHEHFGPMVPGFEYVDINDCEALEKAAAAEDTAAIMLEFVQGEGGVNVVSQEFADTAAKLCRERDILLIADEVQAGNARTGEYYAFMHFGVKPDIMTTAKGLGGGLPVGACVFGEKTMDVLVPGDHGSTFAGNPVACAGAVSVLERMDEELLSEVRRKGDFLRKSFEGAPGVSEVTGLGLMIGITPEKKKAADIVNECLENGVLCITAGQNRVRLLPPLNIPDDLLREAAEVIKAAFAD